MNTATERRLGLSLGLSVFVCGCVLFLYRSADRDLWSSHEARAAQNAQSMLDSGDWLVPRLFDGQPELQKPPLYYWLVAGLGWLRGGQVDAWAVRLPSAVAALGTVLLLMTALAARGRRLAGIAAGLVLATSQHFAWIARAGRLDVPLTFTVAAAILGLSARCRIAWLGGWLAMAAGVLLKGPIALILPLAILAGDAALSRWFDGPRRRRPVVPMLGWGVLLVLALALPWFVGVHFRTGGEFTRAFFLHHHLERALGTSETLAVHPWWTYLIRWLIDPLPWNLLLVPAAWCAWRTAWLREDAIARLGAAWVLVGTALLSLSQFKRADYLLPIYPGMALLIGCLADRLASSNPNSAIGHSSLSVARRLAWGIHAVAALAVIIGIIAIHTVVPALDADRTKSEFAEVIRSSAPRPEMVILFRVEDHLLAFHLGAPVHTLLEWENLDVWAGRPKPSYVVMPGECAAEWRQYISSGTLETVLKYTDRTERRRPRDLVLMKTGPRSSAADGPDSHRSALAARRPRTD